MARKDRPITGEQPLHADDQPQTEVFKTTAVGMSEAPVATPAAVNLLREQDLIATLHVADLMRAAAAVRMAPLELAQALTKAQIIHHDDFARLPWQAE